VAERSARDRASLAVRTTLAFGNRWAGRTHRRLVDRTGAARGTVGDPDLILNEPRVAPDGHRVIGIRTVQGNTDVWLLDGPRMSRLTFDAAFDSRPIWSPDGAQIAFRSNRNQWLPSTRSSWKN